MSTPIVVIAGVSGRLGKLIATALLAKPDVIIHGIARTPSKIPDSITSNSRVKIFEADATSNSTDTIRAAVQGASIVICCYLGDDSVVNDGQKALIDIAIAEKVPRFISSNYSFDFRGLKMNDIPQKNFQLEVEDYLVQKEAQCLIQGVRILNGALTEVIFVPFLGVYDAENKSLNIWGSGDEKYEMTNLEDTAKFTAEVALDPTATGYLKIVTDRVSLKDIKSIHEDVYGQELRLKQMGSLDDLLKAAKTTQTTEPEQWWKWMGMLLNYYCIDGSTFIEGDDRARYGMQGSTLRDLMQAHKQDELPTLMGM